MIQSSYSHYKGEIRVRIKGGISLLVLFLITSLVVTFGFNSVKKEKELLKDEMVIYEQQVQTEKEEAAQKEEELAQQTKDIPTMIHNEREISMVFLGDSITEQNETTAGELNHVGLIEKWLNEEYNELFNIVNSGVSGNSIVQMGERLQNDVLTYKPDLVVVSSGLNDAFGSLRVPVDEFKETYESIIQKLLEDGVKQIVLRTPNPTLNSVYNEQLQPYLTATAELANEYNLPYFDFYDVISKHNEENQASLEQMMTDTVHLNAEGQEFLYKTFSDFISSDVLQ